MFKAIIESLKGLFGIAKPSVKKDDATLSDGRLEDKESEDDLGLSIDIRSIEMDNQTPPEPVIEPKAPQTEHKGDLLVVPPKIEATDNSPLVEKAISCSDIEISALDKKGAAVKEPAPKKARPLSPIEQALDKKGPMKTKNLREAAEQYGLVCPRERFKERLEELKKQGRIRRDDASAKWTLCK